MNDALSPAEVAHVQRAAIGVAGLVDRRKAMKPYHETVTFDELLARGRPWIENRLDELTSLYGFYVENRNERASLTALQIAKLRSALAGGA